MTIFRQLLSVADLPKDYSVKADPECTKYAYYTAA